MAKPEAEPNGPAVDEEKKEKGAGDETKFRADRREADEAWAAPLPDNAQSMRSDENGLSNQPQHFAGGTFSY